MNFKKYVFVICALATSIPAFAGGYGAAGCGLGSIVFGSREGFWQFFALTTNHSTGSQTFGITSGTSNCGSPVWASNKRLEQYIAANRTSLSNEVAKGAGDSVVAVANILACQNPESVGQTLKANYSKIFKDAQTSTEDVSSSMLRVLYETKTCPVVTNVG